MISRGWGTGESHGDGTGVACGTVGADAAAAPKGSALTLIAWTSGLLTLLCVVLSLIFMVANGLLILATVFAAIFAWSIGAFSRSFWSD